MGMGLGLGLRLGNVAASGGGATPVAPNGVITNTILETGRGSSTFFGTGATAGVNDFTGLTNALVTTSANVDITGVFNGRVSDVSDAFTNSGNAHFVSTAKKAGTIILELFGSSTDMAAGGEATIMGQVATLVATLPDTSRLYYIPKFNAGDASAAASIVRANICRRMEVTYPAAVIDWPWYMRNLTPVYSNDVDAQVIGIMPPSYSNNDNLHMGPTGFAAMESPIFEQRIRGQNGQIPFVADGRIIYSRASTVNTNGGLVADFPILDDLTGTTLSTTSTDFAFAQTPANTKSIRITRATATVLKAAYTLVPLTLTKTVGSKLFARTINLRVALGIPQPAAPAINRWNGSGLSTLSSATGIQNAQTITDFSFVIGLRIPAALDAIQVSLITQAGLTLTKSSAGLLTLTIKQVSSASNAIVVAPNSGKTPKLLSANGMVWFFFEGSTVTGSQSNVMYANDTDVSATGQTNVADTNLGFWNTGPQIFYNTGAPDANVVNFNATMVDKTINAANNHTMTVDAPVPTGLYPGMAVAGSGVTATVINNGLNDGTYSMSVANTIAVSTAMTATKTNSMRPVLGAYVDIVGPFLYPGKIGVANQSIRDKFKDGSGNPVDPGTTVAGFTPILDLRGNAADHFRGAAGTDGGMAKNYGTGGDLQLRDGGIGTLVTL